MPYITRPRPPAGIALLAALCAALLAGPARAQEEAPAFYYNSRQFSVPFTMAASRSLRHFHLHASTDRVTYKKAATVGPTERQFAYTAPEDGWYYFIVQVEEDNGEVMPRNVAAAPVGLRVCVDTVKPAASIRPVSPKAGTGGTVAVEWEVGDDHLDLRTLRLQFSVQGSGRWTTLRIDREKNEQLKWAQFAWTPTGAGPFDVRLQVSDLAGNTTTVTTRVAPGTVLPPGPGAASVPVIGRVKHVRSRTFNLNYKLNDKGPSGVIIEVWKTRDTKVWDKYLPPDGKPDNVPETGPYKVTVPASGQWGFILRAVSKVGRGRGEPQPGEQPQIWIVVDDKTPHVELKGVRVSEQADGGYVTVEWEASDDHFPARPITLLHGPAPTGPWQVLAKDLENTGVYKHSAKGLPDTFYVKVEAADEAGNKGESVSKDATTVDLKTPRINEVDVTGEAAEGPAGPGH